MSENIDLKARCLQLLEALSNKPDIESASKMMHPSIQLSHDDNPPRNKETFLQIWPQRMEQAPHFHHDVLDIVREGHKVWVFSRVTGRPDGKTTEDLHMLEFDEEGLCLKSHGVSRPINIEHTAS